MFIHGAILSADIVSWLYEKARFYPNISQVLEELVERTREAGMLVDRMWISIPVLHPSLRAKGFHWTLEKGVELRYYRGEPALEQMYLNSPLKVVHDTGESVRLQITQEAQENEFGIVPDLREAGFTDYIAMPLVFSEATPGTVSMATRESVGFNDADILAFETIAQPLSMLCEAQALKEKAETVLNTYVGPRAGARVLNGEIKRGDGERISAIVGFADLRGFTQLSNQLPSDKIIELLNIYFGAMSEAVERNGGEVLKFIGDEVLSVFPYENEEGARVAAMQALLTAKETMQGIQRANDTSCPMLPDLRLGMGLHAGDVFFGNVGGETRLDFTVVGPTVNKASRIAGLSKDLNQDILTSKEFADILGCHAGALGSYYLKGFEEPQPVFTAPEHGSDCKTEEGKLAWDAYGALKTNAS
ncbi:adenylate/guanylate cyclase domain-containing protein [Pseudovibrio exalbescens]|uniref:adenylate/guanylate cyclase domain-containing protein n=1 Tax=Pseudovibrio exalbescens TaxID=197461 RepID=UPI002366ADD5|nr:adenylate/guanylate cyclase domain-containing protein [Pseudovibrio exalbescens]MDD7910670.1 adenylate/guanylate cyclase domain-containing protein [Pseudovibrio exalbescens]